MKKEKQTSWVRLDNAGKLFAATSNKKDTNVFRFSCELKENVIPQHLETALKQTLTLFPLYRSTLKRGFFWYYLEETTMNPWVKEEHKPVCSKLYDRNKKNLLFRVVYFQKRISIEVHHALSDGTGAIQFFRVLLDFYLKNCYPKELKKLPPIDYDASLFEKKDNSFERYYNVKNKNNGGKSEKAYKLHGEKTEHLGVLIGHMSLKQTLEYAHKNNTTLSILLTSLLFQSIANTMTQRELKKPIVIAVPVNLRNYFESASSRNFFGVINVSYNFKKQPIDLTSIIASVKKQFEEELAKEKVEGRMNRMLALEHNPILRVIPLPLKDFFLKIGSKFSSHSVTMSISNVSSIKLPEQYKPYIDSFDVMIATKSNHMCVCSYEDTLSISFSSIFVNQEIEKSFFRSLTKVGIDVTIISNEEEEHEVL